MKQLKRHFTVLFLDSFSERCRHNKRHLLHDDSKTVKTVKLLGLNVNLGLKDKITHCLQCFIHDFLLLLLLL